jgi:hypothetical protein
MPLSLLPCIPLGRREEEDKWFFGFAHLLNIGSVKRNVILCRASLTKGRDTVGEPRSAEMYVSHMPALKAKKLWKCPQEKVLLEL